MKTKRDFCKLYILLISGLFLFLIPTISIGATFCIDSATGLQTALTTATSNGEDDTIQIVQGNYSGNFIYASTESYGVTIAGGYTPGCASRVVDPANTVLDGNATGNVLVLSCPDNIVEFSVDGVTLQNGNASNDGGGLFARTNNGEITLTNNTITENSSIDEGGGVYAYGNTVTLTSNTITGNSSDGVGGGGGVRTGGGDSSTITLTNNTITKNSSSSRGGGVSASRSSTITLNNNTITGNSGYDMGGGVYASGTITLNNNTITGNSIRGSYSKGGGGVYASGTITLNNNIITGNSISLSASYGSYGSGGGVYANGLTSSTITLNNNTITGNSSSSSGSSGGSGGGVHTEGGGNSTITLNNNTITGNSISSRGGSDSGGGVSMYGLATITLNNNTITGNSSSSSGGGVSANGPITTTTTLINNTITGNSSYNAGGVYVHILFNSNTANIYNNIIHNNSAEAEGNDLYIDNDGNGDFIPSTVNLYNNDFDQSATGTYIQIPFSVDSSNLDNADPLFVNGLDYHLTASSPCINVGSNSAPELPSTDKDGNPRIIGGIVDMGAYERLFAPTVTTHAASSIASTSATLNGEVNPNGASTTVVFEYRNSTSYGGNITATTSPITGGNSLDVSASLTRLNPGSVYHFRVKATNIEGTKFGADKSFSTPYTSTAYVSYDGQCGQNPCYETVQLALDAAEAGSLVKVAEGVYSEAPNWKKAGSVTISGGWRNSFTEHNGVSEIYNPIASGGGTVKLEPNFKVVPQ